jgi:DNA-binding LacI/PurR family transcriptional regulator
MPGVANRRPTSSDVAREAGLSRATVGYVLNDVPHQTIPEPTRQRVLAAAAKLGYRPSAAARSLRTGRSDLVLALLPDWTPGPTVYALMTELSVQLEARGLTFVSHQRSSGGRPLAELWKAISPAAVLVLDRLDPEDAAALSATGLTVSLAVRDGVGDPRMLAVTDERVGRVQAEHLAASDRRTLAYAYPTDDRVSTFAAPRLRGVQQACAELGLAAPVVGSVALESSSADAAVAAWREAGVDGICAYNDELAIALLAALHRSGQTVPGDVAVVGVDDIPLARVSDPPLTTVVSDTATMARYLTEIVVGDIDGRPRLDPPVGSDILDLVVRGSS